MFMIKNVTYLFIYCYVVFVQGDFIGFINKKMKNVKCQNNMNFGKIGILLQKKYKNFSISPLRALYLMSGVQTMCKSF